MGNEFRVNSYQNNWQRESTVTALKGGGFVVTWSSFFNEYDGSGTSFTYVGAQFYNADGQRIGGERVMRAVDQSYSASPETTQLANGNVVVTWVESFEDDIIANGTHIKAQIFTSSGKPVSSILQVDAGRAGDYVSPEVTATKDGGFLITYGGEHTSALYDQVYYRTFGPTGTSRGTEKVLNRNSDQFDELVTRSTALSNGNSVAIWNSEAAIDDGTDNGQNQIRATLFDTSGKAIRSDFGLTPHFGGAGGFWTDNENFGYAVASRAGGGFAVANLDWTLKDDDNAGQMGIYFTTYDARGARVGREIPVFEKGIVVRDLELVRLTTGQYVVSWEQQSLTTSDVGHDAYAMVLSANGRPVSHVFEVGVDDSKYDDQSEISLAALAGGGFVVTYSSEAIDSDDEGIAGRIYGRGTSASDRLTADASGMMSGFGGNDRLTGNSSMNWLAGGAGNDTLTGGGSNDLFVFNAPRSKTTNVDTITDFNESGNDTIQLARYIYTAFSTAGPLQGGAFRVNNSGLAGDSEDRIIYERDTGNLYYDSNGTRAGGDGIIARLDPNLTLSAADFAII